jgi:hypothetical protein
MAGHSRSKNGVASLAYKADFRAQAATLLAALGVQAWSLPSFIEDRAQRPLKVTRLSSDLAQTGSRLR